jgi:hypothetical protein
MGRRQQVNRTPTQKQFERLSVLGGFAIALAPRRGEWGPLVRRGWAEPISEDDPDKRFLPPLRITPAGLRAMADAIERDPALAPDIRGPERKQLNELPRITQLKQQVEDAKRERDAARQECHQMKVKYGKAQRALAGEVVW